MSDSIQDLVLAALRMDSAGLARGQIAELAGLEDNLKGVSRALHSLRNKGLVFRTDDTPAKYFPTDPADSAMIKEAYTDVPEPKLQAIEYNNDDIESILNIVSETQLDIKEIKKAIKPVPDDMREQWLGVLNQLTDIVNDDLGTQLRGLKLYLQETL